jgi:hypothetical protein
MHQNYKVVYYAGFGEEPDQEKTITNHRYFYLIG